MTTAGSAAQHGGRHRGPATGNPFLPLVLDVGVPLASYYLMRHFGVPLVTALAISGLLPAVRVLWSLVRERIADSLAVGVLVLTAVSIPIAFLTGSAKFLLAKESVGTGALGVWLLVSVFLARPAMANGMRAFLARSEGSALAWEQLMAQSARFQGCVRAATVVWGVGFIVECAGRIVIVFSLPVNTAVWAVNVVPAVVLTACVFVQGPWGARAARMIHQRLAENDEAAAAKPVSLVA
jgi:hypothetical protein